MKAIIDIFSTRRAHSNRSLFCLRSSLDGHQPTQDKRYKISLWVLANSWARSSLNRSLSGILKSSLFPASAISGHGLIRISPWAFMWAKSTVRPIFHQTDTEVSIGRCYQSRGTRLCNISSRLLQLPTLWHSKIWSVAEDCWRSCLHCLPGTQVQSHHISPL